ncbi:hypothetical protein TNCV_3277011 [Trichonephila clavipes]|nr:hypothetical protein TNCV_3277011 [Trichonephila clavipes]
MGNPDVKKESEADYDDIYLREPKEASRQRYISFGLELPESPRINENEGGLRTEKLRVSDITEQASELTQTRCGITEQRRLSVTKSSELWTLWLLLNLLDDISGKGNESSNLEKGMSHQIWKWEIVNPDDPDPNETNY